MNVRPTLADRPAVPNRIMRCIVRLVCVVGIALVLKAPQGPNVRLEAAAQPRFKAVAFDYFVLFNPDSVVSDVERIFPGNGRELRTSGGFDSSNTPGCVRSPIAASISAWSGGCPGVRRSHDETRTDRGAKTASTGCLPAPLKLLWHRANVARAP